MFLINCRDRAIDLLFNSLAEAELLCHAEGSYGCSLPSDSGVGDCTNCTIYITKHSLDGLYRNLEKMEDLEGVSIDGFHGFLFGLTRYENFRDDAEAVSERRVVLFLGSHTVMVAENLNDLQAMVRKIKEPQGVRDGKWSDLQPAIRAGRIGLILQRAETSDVGEKPLKFSSYSNHLRVSRLGIAFTEMTATALKGTTYSGSEHTSELTEILLNYFKAGWAPSLPFFAEILAERDSHGFCIGVNNGDDYRPGRDSGALLMWLWIRFNTPVII
jgi:hypothetical protein